MTLPACDCGSTDIFALRPGLEPLRLDAIDLFTRREKAVEAGVADAAWCLACWSKRWGRRAA